MNILFTTIVAVFVVGVLALVVYCMFELTPFSRHAEHYRDPDTGKRLFDSPNLER